MACVWLMYRLMAMTREAKMKELQMLDAARRKFMNYTQQQKETELARLDDEIRRKVGTLMMILAPYIHCPLVWQMSISLWSCVDLQSFVSLN